jgi:hypothetical protein
MISNHLNEVLMNPEALKRDISRWLDANDLRGDATFYSRDEWSARNERVGRDAELTLTIEGSPLYRILNMFDLSADDPKLEREFSELCREHGSWYELGYSWSVHFYCEAVC